MIARDPGGTACLQHQLKLASSSGNPNASGARPNHDTHRGSAASDSSSAVNCSNSISFRVVVHLVTFQRIGD
jgi:hypothetical protein